MSALSYMCKELKSVR